MSKELDIQRLQRGFDDVVGNIIVLTDKLEKSYQLNKLYKTLIQYCDCAYLYDDETFKSLHIEIKQLEEELK